MQIKAILANGKAKSHKVLKGAPSLRAWSLPPAVREIGKRNAEGLSSEARLKEYPCAEQDDSFRHAFGVPTFGVFHRLNPPQAATMENVPRRGRSRLQVEVTLVNEKITEIFDFVILVKLFMLTDCTSLEEGGHGAV